jgi:hypothetical protein
LRRLRYSARGAAGAAGHNQGAIKAIQHRHGQQGGKLWRQANQASAASDGSAKMAGTKPSGTDGSACLTRL